MMSIKKGVISGPKRQFKEKIVQIYETLLKGDTLPTSNQQFWDEFFLLRPKIVHIDNEIQKMSQDQLLLAKTNLNILVNNCIEALNDPNNIRVGYAMQTLCVLTHAIFRKSTEIDPEVFLVGFENSEEKIRQLLKSCQDFLERKLMGGVFTIKWAWCLRHAHLSVNIVMSRLQGMYLTV